MCFRIYSASRRCRSVNMVPVWCEYVRRVRISTWDRALQHLGGVWCDSRRVLSKYRHTITTPTTTDRLADLRESSALWANGTLQPAYRRRSREVGQVGRAGLVSIVWRLLRPFRYLIAHRQPGAGSQVMYLVLFTGHRNTEKGSPSWFEELLVAPGGHGGSANESARAT